MLFNNRNKLKNKTCNLTRFWKSYMRHEENECIGLQCKGSEIKVRLEMSKNSLNYYKKKT